MRVFSFIKSLSKPFFLLFSLYSLLSAVNFQVQALPQTLSCNEIGHNIFFGCYYDSKNFTNLRATRTENQLDFNWSGPPIQGVDTKIFSAQYKGRFVFEAGDYEFDLTSDDGSQLYIDGVKLIEHSTSAIATSKKITKNMKAGQHLVEVKYSAEGGSAILKLIWTKKLGFISSLTLINADSNQDIRELKSGDTINLMMEGSKLSIRANISGLVGSVRFDLDGLIKIDNSAPYAFPSNVGSDYFAFSPVVGLHSFTISPFSQVRGLGVEGVGYKIAFTVISGVSEPKPAPEPPGQGSGTNPSVGEQSQNVLSLSEHSPCKAGNCTVAGPMRITTPGTVIKNMKISNKEGACLVIAAENVRIENSEIGPCSSQAILIQSSGAIISGNFIHHAVKEGIYTYNTTGLTVRGNRIELVAAGVRAVEAQRVVVDRNYIKNMLGIFGTGNLVQFDKVKGPGNKVNCNIGINELGKSNSEDLINIFSSVGTEQDPIQIKGNKLRGGGPALSGGGILLGDAGGSYAIASDNILVDPGQYGIGVVGGHHQTLTSNIVYGKSQSFTNVGIQAWDFYKIGNCTSNAITYNQINFTNSLGRQNDIWVHDSCRPIQGLDGVAPSNTNVWNAPIDETVFNKEIAFCK